MGAKVIAFHLAFLIFLWSSQYLDEGNFSYILESPVKLYGVEEASRRESKPTLPELELLVEVDHHLTSKLTSDISR